MNKKIIVLLSVGTLFLVLFILMYVLIWNAANPLVIDYGVRDFFYSIRGNKYGFCYWFFRIITEFGFLYFAVILTIFSVVLFRLDNRFFIFIFALILATTLQMAFKDSIGRSRPLEDMRWMYEKSTSFPSGHSTTSGVIAVYFIYMIIESKIRKNYKAIIVSGISIIYFLVLCSRLVLGVHYFSDVVAGFSLGGFISIVGIFIHIILNRIEFMDKPLIFKNKDNWIL